VVRTLRGRGRASGSSSPGSTSRVWTSTPRPGCATWSTAGWRTTSWDSINRRCSCCLRAARRTRPAPLAGCLRRWCARWSRSSVVVQPRRPAAARGHTCAAPASSSAAGGRRAHRDPV